MRLVERSLGTKCGPCPDGISVEEGNLATGCCGVKVQVKGKGQNVEEKKWWEMAAFLGITGRKKGL